MLVNVRLPIHLVPILVFNIYYTIADTIVPLTCADVVTCCKTKYLQFTKLHLFGKHSK